MASNDQLWFELGVRDNISSVLVDLMRKAESLAQQFSDIGEMKNAYKNISDVADVYDRIDQTVKRLKSTMSAITNPTEKMHLQKTIDGLEAQRKEYEAILNSTNLLGEKGTAAFKSLQIGTDLALKSAERLVRTTDDLQSKLNGLRNMRMTLMNAIQSAGPSVDTTEATNLVYQLYSREMSIAKAFKNPNKGLPSNLTDGSIDELIKKCKEAAKVLGVDTVNAERAAAQAAKEYSQANQELISTYDRVAAGAKKTNGILSQLQSQVGSYLSLIGAEKLLKSVIQIGGEFEVQHIALQNILGDVQQANSMFEQMKELAVESPFNFRQLASYTKQLAAFNIPYDEMFDTTKRLADMSAGLGVDMSRLILAYGQVRSAAVLRGQELRQFTEAGIPLVQALADEFTAMNGKLTTTADVFELISKRAVPFEMVKKVLWDMTSEGGRFYDMQYVLADTLAGKWSNLRDAWEIMLSDIAKGETMSGRLLKSLVQGLTNLISGLNTVMPLLGGLAGFFAMKSAGQGIVSNLNYGLRGIEQNIKRAQDLHAIELRRKLRNMEITEEQFKQGIALNKNKQQYYMLLAQEGRLNSIQIARAVQQKKINVEKLKERVATGEITMREAAQLRLWRMKYAHANMFKVALASIGRTINTMMGPVGWISLAIDGILTSILWISNHVSEINAKNRELAEGFASRARELKESTESLADLSPTNEEDYKNSIKALKEMLKQHSANYDAIIMEANAMKTLAGQYDFLKSQVAEAKEVYEAAEIESPEFGDKTRKSFEIAKDAASSYFKLLKKGIDTSDMDIDPLGFEAIAEQVKRILPNIGKDSRSNAVFRQLRDAMLQEIGAGSREAMLIKIKLNELLNITDGEDASALVVEEFGKMIDSAAPQIANKIRNGQDLEDAEQDKVQELVRDAMKNIEKEYPYLAKHLQSLLDDSKFTAYIQLRFTQEQQASDTESLIYNRFPSITDEGVKSIATNWVKNAGGNLYEAKNKAHQDIDAALNKKIATHEVTDAIINNAKSSQKEIDKAKRINTKVDNEYNELIEASTFGLGDDYKGQNKKSNKPVGGKKGGKGDDPLKERLKRERERLDEIKSFYTEYKKYRDTYGPDKGLSIVEDIFGFSHEDGQAIVSDYEGVLKGILDKIPENGGTEWQKFATTIKRLLAEIKYDADKEKLQKSLKDMESYIQDETSKWNLYKGLLDKTGNKDFAMQAFVDGVQWDDVAMGMRRRLEDSFGKQIDDWDMSNEVAEAVFGKDTDKFKLYQEIVKTIHENWKNGLNEVAAATEKLMTIEDKILKKEQELSELRTKYGRNDPRAIATEKELAKMNAEAFEQSEPYLKFYSAIFAMTAEEAENVGAKIKENLVQQLAEGGITADKYLKSIKNIDQQLEKVRSSHGDALTLMTGGYQGLMQKRSELYESEAAAAALKVEQAEKKIVVARMAGHVQAEIQARVEKAIAQNELTEAQKKLGWTQTSLKQANELLAVMELITGALDGMRQAAQQVSEMLDALGHEGSANTWSDIADTIGAITSPFSEATNALKSGMSGDVGGLISHTVGIITSPITAFAKLHDKKQQREIENSEKKVKELTNAYNNLQSAMEKALGGIYNTGGYDEMFDNLKQQRDELARQYEAEKGKKKSDSSKLEDYQQQIKEMDEAVKDYALDMANTLYSIDLHSWASTLTDAVVGAWEKGEDAVQAYRDKVNDIMKDLTKNILAKKVMEKAFETLGIDNLIADMIDSSHGKLDETVIPRLADALYQAGDMTVNAITGVFDELESKGYATREQESTSKSTSASIKSITEETADLLASYINAIRADVSVNRMTLTEMLMLMQGQSEMPMIAQAQLQQLEFIAQNTAQTAQNTLAIGEIYALLTANTLGANYFYVK